jgi:hypothetical protein
VRRTREETALSRLTDLRAYVARRQDAPAVRSVLAARCARAVRIELKIAPLPQGAPARNRGRGDAQRSARPSNPTDGASRSHEDPRSTRGLCTKPSPSCSFASS